jgi:hypothetical protein
MLLKRKEMNILNIIQEIRIKLFEYSPSKCHENPNIQKIEI